MHEILFYLYLKLRYLLIGFQFQGCLDAARVVGLDGQTI